MKHPMLNDAAVLEFFLSMIRAGATEPKIEIAFESSVSGATGNARWPHIRVSISDRKPDVLAGPPMLYRIDRRVSLPELSDNRHGTLLSMTLDESKEEMCRNLGPWVSRHSPSDAPEEG